MAYHKTCIVSRGLVQMFIRGVQIIVKAVSDTVEYFIFMPGTQRIVCIGSQFANRFWGHPMRFRAFA